ncbi:MAG: hypothetical protein ACYCY0_09950 [Acidithiobacillus ferrivorans]
MSDDAYRPLDIILPAALPHKGFSKIATETILTTKERATRIAGKALDMKREFITAWEIQFLNGIRVSGIRPEELTQQQMGTIDIIGKRLWLIDLSSMREVMV